MSTKKLERTVIEGGRGRYNKKERYESQAILRAEERNYLADVQKDPERFDEEIIEKLQPVSKGFTDKLRPMYRWLAVQVGRKWAEVHKEIFEKFDTKTTAGRHITFDHLLSSVVDTRSGWDQSGYHAANQTSFSNRYPRYYVDDLGVLCRATMGVYNRKRYKDLSPEEYRIISVWLNGRMVGEHGGVLYWFASPDGLWKCEWKKEYEQVKYYGEREGSLDLHYYVHTNGDYEQKVKNLWVPWGPPVVFKRQGYHWEWLKNPAGFKQRSSLNKNEVKYFRSFDKKTQDQILSYAKGRF